MLEVAVVEHFEVHHVVPIDAEVLASDDDGEFEDTAIWEAPASIDCSWEREEEKDRPPMRSLRLPGSS